MPTWAANDLRLVALKQLFSFLSRRRGRLDHFGFGRNCSNFRCLRGCVGGDYLDFFCHWMQQVRRWIRCCQYGAEHVDAVKDVLINGEQNLGNLGFRINF